MHSCTPCSSCAYSFDMNVTVGRSTKVLVDAVAELALYQGMVRAKKMLRHKVWDGFR